MKERRIGIRQCKYGDILTRDVVCRYGAIIVTAHTAINRYIKCKLVSMGIEEIWICDDRGGSRDDGETGRERAFKRDYEGHILEMKDMIRDLAAGRRLNPGKLRQMSDAIYDEIAGTGCIVKCLTVMENMDGYIYHHSINVAFYAMLLGKWMGLPENEMKDVIKAGLLHDIGKTRIAVDILNKKGKLLPEEFETVKMHTVYGYEIVKDIEGLPEEVKQVTLMHHERMDGSGYPAGLKADKINRYARMIAIADVYDAMTSERIYKKRSTPFEVFEMFQTIGVCSFDPKMLQAFLTHLTPYYIGAKVRLNTGDCGEIVYIPPHDITKPIVYVAPVYIDISRKEGLEILSME